mmetsp:Transcript_52181/g.138184  ORF Transcript_52181/g.138184 Transcript_52181/m.138184 type:complete len:222 (+) Transcript_52181:5714-6379(+)
MLHLELCERVNVRRGLENAHPHNKILVPQPAVGLPHKPRSTAPPRDMRPRVHVVGVRGRNIPGLVDLPAPPVRVVQQVVGPPGLVVRRPATKILHAVVLASERPLALHFNELKCGDLRSPRQDHQLRGQIWVAFHLNAASNSNNRNVGVLLPIVINPDLPHLGNRGRHTNHILHKSQRWLVSRQLSADHPTSSLLHEEKLHVVLKIAECQPAIVLAMLPKK